MVYQTKIPKSPSRSVCFHHLLPDVIHPTGRMGQDLGTYGLRRARSFLRVALLELCLLGETLAPRGGKRLSQGEIDKKEKWRIRPAKCNEIIQQNVNHQKTTWILRIISSFSRQKWPWGTKRPGQKACAKWWLKIRRDQVNSRSAQNWFTENPL